tara:strand:+ start:426 stop:1259 length:834 start_codon:yes stop_codon:yes gene_type:complete
MFVFKEWDRFCSEIKNKNINCLRAFDALEAAKTNSRYLIIKHDVETNVNKALKIAQIENKYNIKTTYYVQSYLIENKSNVKLLKKICDLGHEVTYHYDVLDSNKGNYDLAIIEFEKTILKFNKLFQPVKTICPHGNPVMKRNGWSSNKDFFRNKKIKNKFSDITDIVINPEKFINKELAYISDAGFDWKLITSISENDRDVSVNKSLNNLKNVLTLIDDKTKSIILSSHPHRWVQNKNIAKLKRYIFFALRSSTLALIKIPLLNFFFSKFYYLAKKI